MQPAALGRGLANTLPNTVSLFENSAVIHADFSGPVVIKTAHGQINAPLAILAVNGMASEFGVLKGRVFNVPLFASMTRPLTDEEHSQMGCDTDWGIVPSMAFGGPTLRYTQDRRLVIRSVFGRAGDMRPSASVYSKAVSKQSRQLSARFPHLPKDLIQHTWSGVISMSKNFAPGFGWHGDCVISAVCQNGVGVTKGTMSGILAADLACRRKNPHFQAMAEMGKPARLPPEPILTLGVSAKVKMWEFQQRFEA